jgi:hypothetical protein
MRGKWFMVSLSAHVIVGSTLGELIVFLSFYSLRTK